MYYKGDIKYKNISSDIYDLIITKPPQVKHSEIRGDVYQIPYRDGELHSARTYRGDAQIVVAMALTKSTVADYVTRKRQIEHWLSGTGVLVTSDATDAFYEVKRVELTSDDRVMVNFGEIEATFIVHPYEFLTSGNTETSATSINNLYDKSMPLYKITGTANAEGVLTVNNNTMNFKIPTGGILYIDTRRMIAYGENNINASDKVGGDYEGLYLRSGNNSLSITNGTLKTYPHWGYEI